MQISKSRQRPIIQKTIKPRLEDCFGPKPKDLLRSPRSVPSDTDPESSEGAEGFFLGEGRTDDEPEIKKKRSAFTEIKSFKVPIFKVANGIKEKVYLVRI